MLIVAAAAAVVLVIVVVAQAQTQAHAQKAIQVEKQITQQRRQAGLCLVEKASHAIC